jgi:hypothetical protein
MNLVFERVGRWLWAAALFGAGGCELFGSEPVTVGEDFPHGSGGRVGGAGPEIDGGHGGSTGVGGTAMAGSTGAAAGGTGGAQLSSGLVVCEDLLNLDGVALTPFAHNAAATVVDDFNQDGMFDVATANNDVASVSVALGRGDGTFENLADYAAASVTEGLTGIATSDLDGDGALDLIAWQGSPGVIAVFPGHGDGTFSAAMTTVLGTEISGITAADFDADGQLDLATSGDFQVLLNDGDATFTPVEEPVGGLVGEVVAWLFSVASGDLDQDGASDLVAAGGGALFSKGDGTFEPGSTVGGDYERVALLELNGDGRLDLVAETHAPKGGGRSVVALGNGDGTFQELREYAWSPHWPSLPGDLNRDGALDLLGHPVLLGHGDGTFEEGPDFYGRGLIRDFDGDGELDSLRVSRGSSEHLGAIQVLSGNGDGSFGPELVSPGLWGSIALPDLDGDGILDRVVTTALGGGPDQPGTIAVELGRGDGTFTSAREYTTDEQPSQLALGDLDDDGQLDFLTASKNVPSVSVWLGTTPGNHEGPLQAATSSAALDRPELADMNGDEKLDLVTFTAAGVGVSLGNGDGTFASSIESVASYPIRDHAELVAADLSGDGFGDVAFPIEGALVVLIGDGAGSFASTQRYELEFTAIALELGDLDADGHVDIITADDAGVAALLGNGDGTFRVYFTLRPTSFVGDIALGDVDGDEKLDVVLADDGYAVLRGAGDGTFSCEIAYPTFGERWLALGDVNGDGKLDFTGTGREYGVTLLNQRR